MMRGPRILVLLALGLCALVTGCAHAAADLTLIPQYGKAAFTQRFNSAYAAVWPDGTADVVLLNDELADPAHDDPHQSLQPITPSPLRQIMHIRIFWNENQAHVIHEASLANATVDWDLIGNEPGHIGDVLRYAGAGYARIDHFRSATGLLRVDVRQVHLQATFLHGGLRDGLGPCVLQGFVYARQDENQVREVLKMLANDQSRRGVGTSVPAAPPSHP